MSSPAPPSPPSRLVPPPTPSLDLEAALRAVRELVPATPLLELPEVRVGGGAGADAGRPGRPPSDASRVYAKLESLQVTGSFKVRGAAAKMAGLTAEERRQGVVACSSGNHGRAVAWVAGRLGVPAVVCVPGWVDAVKLEAIRREGARAVLAGPSYDHAAREAAALARERGLAFIHPFDDAVVAAGQGTVALEILEMLPDVGTVVVPLSGGGLAGGIGYALKARGRDVRVVAASARRARVMWESLRAGRPVEMEEEETLASALSGGIELDNRITFELVRDHVDGHVLVDETAIARAMAWAWRERRLVVEGGGAVALAALLEGSVRSSDGRPVVAVVSGGNLSLDALQEVLERTE